MKNTETQNNKMTIEELVKFLVANFKDEYGYLDLRGLDFTKEDIKVILISHIKVNGDLYQDNQKVKGSLYLGYQEVKGDLHQEKQDVEGDLWQNYQKVGGNIVQDNQNVEGCIFQGGQNCEGEIYGQDCGAYTD